MKPQQVFRELEELLPGASAALAREDEAGGRDRLDTPRLYL
jgi:hypothetical protein